MNRSPNYRVEVFNLHRQLTVLDRFVAGNNHALALVRVSTPEQECSRTESRLRQRLRKDLKRIDQRGCGLLSSWCQL